jgi:hypothetical protein
MSLTDEHVLAAYVEGNDLHAVASTLREGFRQFIEFGRWPTDQVLAVDRQHSPDPDAPGCLPQWDLGLNLGLDHLNRSPDWFSSVEALVEHLERLHAETGEEFVLFLCFQSRPWLQEHLTFIGGGAVKLPRLKGAIERLTFRSSGPRPLS